MIEPESREGRRRRRVVGDRPNWPDNPKMQKAFEAYLRGGPVPPGYKEMDKVMGG